MSHISLRFEDGDREPQLEPVHATKVGDRRYCIDYSPGWVYGVAAGDEIELTDSTGGFEVRTRGGNVSVRVFAETPINKMVAALEIEVQGLGGRTDGGLERAAMFTVPVSVGFAAIEAVFSRFVSTYANTHWEYGNVYDQAGVALGWWGHQGS